jgi:hypothetical protein
MVAFLLPGELVKRMEAQAQQAGINKRCVTGSS